MSNVYKGYFVQVEDDNTRIVDSNELVRKKIEEEELRLQRMRFLTEELGLAEESEGEGEFREGLFSTDISGLVSDDAEGVNIINSPEPKISKEEQELEEIRAEIEKANEELAQIKAEAESYLQNAQNEIDIMSQNAYEEAKSKGYSEGREIGIHEADALKEEYERNRVELENEYQGLIEELEPMMVDTLTGIYEKLFRVELSDKKSLILNLLTEAINDSGQARNIVIHVNKEDYQTVLESRDIILTETGMLEDNVEFIQDGTLGSGGCLIETENGIYDCSLETELKELRNKLMLISRT